MQNTPKSYIGGILLVLMLVTGVGAVHRGIINFHKQSLLVASSESIKLYKASLVNEITRFDFLPYVIAHNKEIVDMLWRDSVVSSVALQKLKQASGADELFILDPTGEAIASSNWQSPLSFVGNNYSFRPYFIDALLGHRGRFYAIGTTTGKPGFFISSAILIKGKVAAVAVAKVNLGALEQTWVDAPGTILLSNQDDVVLLSNNDKLRYKALKSLSTAQLEAIAKQKQFADQPLSRITQNVQENTNTLTLNDHLYIEETADVGVLNWKLHYLVPARKLNQLAIISWGKISLIVLGIIVGLLLLRFLRAREALRHSRDESASLRDFNQRLEEEIVQRKQVEIDLREAQDEIQRSSKLVAMGQLSASIIHELSQPLTAMKTYIAAAQLPKFAHSHADEKVHTVLPKLEDLNERMVRIITQLRYFARNDEPKLSSIDIGEVLSDALLTTQAAINDANIDLHVDQPSLPLVVLAGKVRMGQVIVNLINNAIAAMENVEDKKLKIRIGINSSNYVVLEVEDSGGGFTGETQELLFEPFFTTKASGEGLGLGLTISSNIISSFGGTLCARNNPDGGARFIVSLPLKS